MRTLSSNSPEITTDPLEAYLKVIPAIHAMLPDIGIGITNTKEWIAYYPGRKIDIGATPGKPIDPKEPLADCITNRKVIREEVPPEFFGLSFTGLAAPIIENRQVIGAIAIQIQEQNEKELKRISDQIVKSLTQANERITTISKGADGLAAVSQKLQEQSTTASDGMRNTDEVIKFIKKIADQTNLLGLNASIEAARAGDKGRGFDIVAREIRKLSNETVASTEKINNILKNMQNSIDQITASVEKVVSVGRDQALSTDELSSFIDEIEKMSKELSKHAEQL